MRENYPQFADEQFEFGILKAEDNQEEKDEWRVDLNLQKVLSSKWFTWWSSPHTPHTSWHTWHIHLSNIWLKERKFVKSSTLLRLKTPFQVIETPEILNQSSKHVLWRATTSQIYFLWLTPQKFSLWRPRGATRPISVPCYYSLFPQDTTVRKQVDPCRTKGFLESCGCRTRPLKTSGYQPWLTQMSENESAH